MTTSGTPETDAPPDAPGSHLVELDEATCLARLAERPLGRMALTVGALPVVLPVNYVIRGRTLLMATDPGLKLSSARSRDVVCLEVDDWDEPSHSGWYVTATGHLSVVTDERELASFDDVATRAWRRLADAHHIKLTIELLSGRELVGPALEVATRDRLER